MSTLLIIDDDPEIASALARGLGLHGYLTETQNRADRGLDRLKSGAHAGAIVDVMLGADSGIDLVRTARTQGVSIPILMLSALSEVEHRTAGLEAGADDYLIKPFTFDELVARLRVQEHRVSSTRPGPARLVMQHRRLRSGDATALLTERECDLLLLLAGNGTVPMPRAQIFDALWAGDGSGNENVVDVYIGYLRKKLAAADFGLEIKTIRNQGFCLAGQVVKVESH